MSQLNDILASSPVPLVAGDKTYQVSPITKNIQAAFELWHEEQLYKQASKVKPMLSESEYRKMLLDLGEEVASGKFSFGSPASVEFINTKKGASYFFWLLMKVHQPTMTQDDCERLAVEFPEEVMSGVSRLVGGK